MAISIRQVRWPLCELGKCGVTNRNSVEHFKQAHFTKKFQDTWTDASDVGWVLRPSCSQL